MPPYDVTLNNHGLLLADAGYAAQPRDPFVSRVATGPLRYDDRRDELVVTVNDWSGGEGFLRHDPEQPGRYRLGPGADGFSEPGALRFGLGASSVYSAGAGDSRPARCHAALGKLFVGGDGGKVYLWDGATFSLAFTLGGGNAASFAEFQGKLYLGKSAGGGGIARWDGATLTDPFLTLPAPVSAVYSMGVFYRGSLGYLYFAGDAPDGVRIHYTDGVSLSGLRYQLNEPAIRSAPLVIGSKVGFVGVDLSSSPRSSVHTVVDSGGSEKWAFEASLAGRALVSGAVVGEVGYLGSDRGGELYRWDGLSLDRLPSSVSQPYPVSLASASGALGALWLGVSAGAGGASGTGLKRYDAIGWSEPAAIDSAFPGEIGGLAFYNGDLYATRHATGASQWRVARYRFDQFPASATLETGLVDARLPGIAKSWRSLSLTHSALASGQGVQVQFRLEDAGSWTVLGASSAVGATSATFGFASVVAVNIAFRIVLNGPAGSSTPLRVYSLETRCVPRPPTKREWDIAVRLEGTAVSRMIRRDGTREPLTGEQISANLWAAYNSPNPVPFVDRDGATYSVWVATYREEITPRLNQSKGTQLQARLRLLEV